MTTYSEVDYSGSRASFEISHSTDRNLDIVSWGLVAVYATIITGQSLAPGPFGGVWMLPVLLPTVFLLVHGSRTYGIRTSLFFAVVVLLVSNLFENASTATGFPFGNYYYSQFSGPRVLNVPVLIGPAYLGMGYLSWTLARLLLGRTREALRGVSLITVPVVASFLMVAWDLTFDPVSSTINGFWIWEQGGAYFGVPLSNYFGWFLTVLVFFAVFAVHLSRRTHESAGSARQSGQYWLQAVALYAAAAIPALLGPLTHAASGTVIDPSGTAWLTTDIYLTVALAASFTMVPFAVIGALKAIDLSLADAPRAYERLRQPTI
jgi:putative membrane protein